eukprot:75619-Amorphochlora_amoeboformis.AAC.1
MATQTASRHRLLLRSRAPPRSRPGLLRVRYRWRGYSSAGGGKCRHRWMSMSTQTGQIRDLGKDARTRKVSKLFSAYRVNGGGIE